MNNVFLHGTRDNCSTTLLVFAEELFSEFGGSREDIPLTPSVLMSDM